MHTTWMTIITILFLFGFMAIIAIINYVAYNSYVRKHPTAKTLGSFRHSVEYSREERCISSSFSALYKRRLYDWMLPRIGDHPDIHKGILQVLRYNRRRLLKSLVSPSRHKFSTIAIRQELMAIRILSNHLRRTYDK